VRVGDAFDKHFGRVLLVTVTGATLGGGAIRLGTDKLTDEVTKLREVLSVVAARVENHEGRITTIEKLIERLLGE
jgi:hypothetical protein